MKLKKIFKSFRKRELKIIQFFQYLKWKNISKYKNLKVDDDFLDLLIEKKEQLIPQKMLVCISFFFNIKKISDLKTICDELINCAKNVEIIIFTNEENENRIKLLKEINESINIVSVKNLGHPYLLTWSHYSIVKEKINDNSYSHFMYLEDDIYITRKNIIYWMKSRDILKEYNLIPQLLRVEKNSKDNEYYCTDILKKINLNKMPKVYNIKKNIAYSNISYPYQGCYFFDRELMIEHLNSASSSPDFVTSEFVVDNYFIREKANMGLMYTNIPDGFINRHVIPVILNRKIPHESCTVRHLGDKYANDELSIFCKIKIKDIFL